MSSTICHISAFKPLWLWTNEKHSVRSLSIHRKIKCDDNDDLSDNNDESDCDIAKYEVNAECVVYQHHEQWGNYDSHSVPLEAGEVLSLQQTMQC